MKNLIMHSITLTQGFIFGVIFYQIISFNTNDYTEGWKDGYKAGYCFEIINCVEPIPPVAPVPKAECPSGYKCGYNRGFVKGKKDKE